jgi:hypothetical protein
MSEPFPRSFYAVWSNPLPGSEDALHAWYEDVHIPDSLNAGLFDSVRRYRALDETAARFLTLWGCDYGSEDEALAAVRPVAEGLRARGRVERVQEVVFQQFVFLEKTLRPRSEAVDSGLLTLQSVWSRPESVAVFDTWLASGPAPVELGVGGIARYGVPAPRSKALVLVEAPTAGSPWPPEGAAAGLPPFGPPTPIFEGGSPAPSPAPLDPEALAKLEQASPVRATRWQLISRR